MIRTAAFSQIKAGNFCFAVTGNPVLHSKSPVIFNTIFQRLGMGDSHVYTRIAANTPAEAMFLFNELRLSGMNVTAPFKAGIMAYLDEVDDAAKTIGGVNTVVREEMGIKGYNTDFMGVTGALAARGIDLERKRCVVLGAGGAGRAAVYGLLREKASVTLVNRTYEKALAVAGDLGCACEKVAALPELLQSSDILVSTLSSEVDIIPADWLRKGLVVFDANYKKSLLIEKAEKMGCQTIKGEEWLLNQAIPAYGYFLGSEQSQLINISKVLGGVGTLFQKGSDPPEAKVIALVGFMGSGKSVIGKKLAQKLGCAFKDLDEIIEKRAGLSIPDIFNKHGEERFRSLEKEILAETIMGCGCAVIACGGGVVLDAENREMLKNNCLVIWLYASLATSLKRIPKGTRPLLDCAEPGKEAQRILNDRLFRYAQVVDLVVSSEPEVLPVVEKISDEVYQAFNN